MALLTNINGKFSVDTDGAASFNRIGASETTGFTFPSADGANGEVLKTNGLGTVSWLPDSSPTVYWAANGNDIYNTNSANVGIGTATVNSKLEIYSTATFDPRTSGINIHRPGSFGQYGSIAYNVNETVISSTYTGTGATDYGAIKFQQFNNGTVPRVVMFLNTVGNVGIGTVTPGTKLEIKNPDTSGSAARTVVTRQLTLNANGGNNLQPYEGFGTGIIFEGYDYAGGGGTSGPRDYAYIDSIIENSGSTPVDFRSQLKFYTNPGGSNTQTPTPKMVIEGGGNVGIGTISPNNPLTVAGNLLVTTTVGDGQEDRFKVVGGGSGDDGNVYVYNDTQSATIRLNSGGASYFTNGLMVGYTSGSYKVQVLEESTNTTNIGVYTNIRGAGTNNYAFYADAANGTSTNFGFYGNSGKNAFLGDTGIGTDSPDSKLHVKDSQDSSLYSGLKVERSANTTGAYLNAVGGALNLNTDSSMPLKFRILNTSMQTINTDGGRAYAPNASGLSMKEYGYNFTAANGTYTDLIENSSAHTDLAMVQISITAYHSSRTYFAGMGTFGGYGFAITGGGTGMANGGLVSAVTGSGTRKIQWYNGSGYNATVRLYIQLRTESGITVLNGTLSSL
jgi:hypothetical protein